jgi:hypothetical protein
MKFWRKTLFFLLLATPCLALADGQSIGGNSDDNLIQLSKNCVIEKLPGARVQPQVAWYEKFKRVFNDLDAQSAYKDNQAWKAPGHEFDTCSAFKVLMGIGWKESGLNPGLGAGGAAIPAIGIFQIQPRNCAGVGVSGNLYDPLVSVECAAKIMRMNFWNDSCVADTFNGSRNGRCLTNWSVMLCRSKSNVGHREQIRQYQNGQSFCQ